MRQSSFASRLAFALEARNMKAADLSKATKVSEGTISCYINGRYEAKHNRVNQFAKALKVNPAWLMGYDVPMDEDEAEPTIPPGFEPLPKMSLIPRVGAIACGDPILAEQNIEDYDKVPEDWHADFTLVCEGDSMEPRIKNGDVVAIRKQLEVETGEIAAVRIEDNATLKRVYRYPDRLVLQPENPAFPPIVLVGEEINTVTIEGKAVGLCRRL